MLDATVTPEQRWAALRALSRAWQQLNWSVFGQAMSAPVLELSGADGQLGRYTPRHRALALSERLVFGQPWLVVLEVLKHEMAHQYVHEVLRVDDESAHGAAFHHVCRRFSIDATASGLPSADGADAADERLRARVAQLLALADSPNQHEAEAAMRAAQRLMLKHNLETQGARRDYVWKTLGEPTGRVQVPERYLATILIEHFFVEAIWTSVFDVVEQRDKSVLEVCGTASNVALAEYVYAFLRETGERLWRAHKRRMRITVDRDRRRFLAGVMLGFREKLRDEAEQSRESGLVWVADAGLTAYFRGRYPRTAAAHFGGGRATEAHAHGRHAGREIVLHRPVTSGPSDAGPRLLGPRRLRARAGRRRSLAVRRPPWHGRAMSKLRVGCFTVSADGYGAGPRQDRASPLGVGGEQLHRWFVPTRSFRSLLLGDAPAARGMSVDAEGTTGVDDDFARRSMDNVGAWILGRNMFGPVRGPWPDDEWRGWWGSNPPYHVPVFVLTHHRREPIEMEGGTTFHFVTGGIDEALRRARVAAGPKDVRLGGGVDTIRQYLRAGLVDELHLVITPALLGSGEHLLSGLDLVALGYQVDEHATSEAAVHMLIRRHTSG